MAEHLSDSVDEVMRTPFNMHPPKTSIGEVEDELMSLLKLTNQELEQQQDTVSEEWLLNRYTALGYSLPGSPCPPSLMSSFKAEWKSLLDSDPPLAVLTAFGVAITESRMYLTAINIYRCGHNRFGWK